MDNIANCGLNCNACSFRIACVDKDSRHLQPMPNKYESSKSADITKISPCPGCKLDSDCGDCKIKDCITEKNNNSDSMLHNCSECTQFPCNLFKDFSDDGIPHHFEALKNLEYIKANGINDFIEREQAKWTCDKCHKKLSWYLTACPDCSN